MEYESQMQFMQLPECLFEEILSYMTYDDISKYRLVSRAWNSKCKQCLTRGFYAVEKYHAQSFKNVKAMLPRRESERRNHSLARHCDILTAIETRLSMLSMTFTKYIDVGLCCFIPGKVIDEIFRVLHFIKEMKNPPRAHEILQELRDISSMAMEHFDEKVVPQLKETLSFSPTYPITGGPGPGVRHCEPTGSTVSMTYKSVFVNKTGIQVALQKLRLEMLKHSAKTKQTNVATNQMRVGLTHLSAKIRRQNLRLKQIVAQQDAKMAEMKCQIEECNQKITDLKTKVSKMPEPDAGKVPEPNVSMPATRSSKRVRFTKPETPEPSEEKSQGKKLRR